MREVDDQLEGLVAERLEGQDDVVDQEVAVRFPDLVPTCDVVEDRVAGPRSSGLRRVDKNDNLFNGMIGMSSDSYKRCPDK